jgi:hypothetical protein
MHGLEADVAFLALGVVRARLDRDRDCFLTFFFRMILFRVAAAVNLLTDLHVAAASVIMLACGIAISRFAPHTPRGVVGQWRGAGGAGREQKHIVRWRDSGTANGQSWVNVTAKPAIKTYTTDY